MSTYSELLRDPRWQKRRLEVLSAANWMCSACFETTLELHVHHVRYKWNRAPWEYSNEELRCLCKSCHQTETDALALLKDELMLCGIGAKVFVPMLAGFMAEYGFIAKDGEILEKARGIDSQMMDIGRIAAQIDLLPEDLADGVLLVLDSAIAEMAARIADYRAGF